MKREVAEKWVEALRSGQFKQGKGVLKNQAGYCCLGVLCEISGLGKFETSYNDHYNCFVFREADGPKACNYLPPQVQAWAGLRNHNPAIPSKVDTPAAQLAKMNDDGATFDELATLIDANWEHL